jgi:hypothetical protein
VTEKRERLAVIYKAGLLAPGELVDSIPEDGDPLPKVFAAQRDFLSYGTGSEINTTKCRLPVESSPFVEYTRAVNEPLRESPPVVRVLVDNAVAENRHVPIAGPTPSLAPLPLARDILMRPQAKKDHTDRLPASGRTRDGTQPVVPTREYHSAYLLEAEVSERFAPVVASPQWQHPRVSVCCATACPTGRAAPVRQLAHVLDLDLATPDREVGHGAVVVLSFLLALIE